MLETAYNALDYIAAWVKIMVEKLAKFLKWKEKTEEKLSSVYADDDTDGE